MIDRLSSVLETKHKSLRSIGQFGGKPMSSARIFFAGMATTILLLGVGFSGGLMLARTAMEPVQQSRPIAANRSAPDRVGLPASAEAHAAPAQPEAPPTPATALEQPQAPTIQAREVQGTEKDKEAERAEQRRADAIERERRRHSAERKAKREAARLKQRRDQQEQEAQRQERPGIMAFGLDESQPRPGGFFGN